MQQRLLIGTPEAPARSIFPDVHIAEPGPRRRHEEGEGGVAVAPVEVELAEGTDELIEIDLDERPTEGFIEIVEDGREGRVVTVIEVLSPSNKAAGRDRESYLRNRDDLEAAGVNLVEIDLLRGGPHVVMAPWELLPRSHRTPYLVCVRRVWRPNRVAAYRVPLQSPLPRISIPLRWNDREVSLDLQALVESAYANGRYDDIDYRAEPDPPLEPADVAWADGLLRQAGRR